MPVELLLKVRLRIGSPLEGIHRNFEFSAAKGAGSDCRSGVKPFDDPNAALDHVSFSAIGTAPLAFREPLPGIGRRLTKISIRIRSEDRYIHGLLTPPSPSSGYAPGFASEQTKVLA